MSSIIQNDLCTSFTLKQPTRPFHHRLIMRDYRQIKPPLAEWASNLRNLVHDYHLKGSELNYEKEIILSDWFWQASDIFIYAGQFREAREMCYAHIQLMLNLSQTQNQNDCLWYAFKSWINLARVDRLCKQYLAASKKLQAHTHWRDKIFQKHYAESNVVSVAMERVRREYQIEKIKLCFSTHQVERIIDEFAMLHQYYPNQHAYVIDALILAYVQAGDIQDALQLAEKMQTVKAIAEFAFIRAQEIKWSYYHQVVDVEALANLAETKLQYLNGSSVQLPELILSLHLARFLYQLKMTEEAATLLTLCLHQAIKLNDEVFKADVLALMFTVGMRRENNRSLEDELVAIYHETQYPTVRATLARANPELKHVEINQDFHQLAMLSHDFMLLASAG